MSRPELDDPLPARAPVARPVPCAVCGIEVDLLRAACVGVEEREAGARTFAFCSDACRARWHEARCRELAAHAARGLGSDDEQAPTGSHAAGAAFGEREATRAPSVSVPSADDPQSLIAAVAAVAPGARVDFGEVELARAHPARGADAPARPRATSATSASSATGAPAGLGEGDATRPRRASKRADEPASESRPAPAGRWIQQEAAPLPDSDSDAEPASPARCEPTPLGTRALGFLAVALVAALLTGPAARWLGEPSAAFFVCVAAACLALWSGPALRRESGGVALGVALAPLGVAGLAAVAVALQNSAAAALLVLAALDVLVTGLQLAWLARGGALRASALPGGPSAARRAAERVAGFGAWGGALVAGLVTFWLAADDGEALAAGGLILTLVGSPVLFAGLRLSARDARLDGERGGASLGSEVALEGLSRLRMLIVCGRGALTAGRPRVARVLPCRDSVAGRQVLEIAAALAPAALRPALESRLIEEGGGLLRVGVTKREGAGARGVAADGRVILFGDEAWLASQGVSAVGFAPERDAESLDERWFVAAEGQLLGSVELSDPLSAGVARLAAEQARLGVDAVVLADADSLAWLRRGAVLGTDDVRLVADPAALAAEVTALSEARGPAAVLAESTEESAALEAAELALALGASGTDTGPSGIALPRGDLGAAALALAVGRAYAEERRLLWSLTLGAPAAVAVVVALFGAPLSVAAVGSGAGGLAWLAVRRSAKTRARVARAVSPLAP